MERRADVDWVRTVSVLGVILLHASSGFVFRSSRFAVLGMTPALLCNQAARFSVPVFFLLSGLGLGLSKREAGLPGFWLRRMRRKQSRRCEQMVPEYKKIRLRFRKTGDAKFISHLDLDRTMKSALTRAGIKVEHTHGFNPRPYLVFSLPTSVGTESLCEFLDIKAEEGSDPAVMKAELNAKLPPEIRDLICP